MQILLLLTHSAVVLRSVFLSLSLPTVLLVFSFMYFDLFATFDFYLFGTCRSFPVFPQCLAQCVSGSLYDTVEATAVVI